MNKQACHAGMSHCNMIVEYNRVPRALAKHGTALCDIIKHSENGNTCNTWENVTFSAQRDQDNNI